MQAGKKGSRPGCSSSVELLVFEFMCPHSPPLPPSTSHSAVSEGLESNQWQPKPYLLLFLDVRLLEK